jgi:hypothetical protein
MRTRWTAYVQSRCTEQSHWMRVYAKVFSKPRLPGLLGRPPIHVGVDVVAEHHGVVVAVVAVALRRGPR